MDTFIKQCIMEMLNNGVNIYLIQKKRLPGNYGGWFGDDPLEFRIAVDHDLYFALFCHEYSHFLQYKEDREFWDKYSQSNTDLFSWLKLDRYWSKTIDEAVKDAITLEHDCERRALALIKENSLPINRKYYAQCANAYLWSYHFVRKFRQWSSQPLYTPDITDNMPGKLMHVEHYLDYNNFNKDLEKLYLSKYS